VSGSDDHTIALWDSRSGQRLHTVTFKSAVMAVSWHPEEVSKLMVAEKNGVLHMFNIVSYHPILSPDCGTGPLLSADWSLYNSDLIATSIRSDVIIWDLSKMAPITKKYLRQDNVKSVKMSPTSESVLATSGQPNYSVKISNIKNSHVTPLMTNQPIGGISWHPVKNILIVGHDENVSVHHVTKKM
jgi:WD40 repeat protein